MSNELLFFINIIVYFSLMLCSYKLFGKVGLYIWVAIGMIYSNIEVLLMVNMFGREATLGNVIYGSTFLATDILNENHSKKEANFTVAIGFFAVVSIIILTQVTMLFIPNQYDFAMDSFKGVFELAPRIAFASIFTYLASQLFDIWVYQKIKAKTGEKHLWIRNNASTLVSQLIDTVVFTTVAFYGILENEVLFGMILPSYFIKLLVSILDTPFMYIGKKMKYNILKI